MKDWKLYYWAESSGKQPVEQWLDNLNDTQFKCISKELALLKYCGNELRLPHSKALKNGLFELRERTFQYRIYYTFLSKQRILLLQAGCKSSQ